MAPAPSGIITSDPSATPTGDVLDQQPASAAASKNVGIGIGLAVLILVVSIGITVGVYMFFVRNRKRSPKAIRASPIRKFANWNLTGFRETNISV
jgi:hypothetical protein